jgi:hypothetical protein
MNKTTTRLLLLSTALLLSLPLLAQQASSLSGAALAPSYPVRVCPDASGQIQATVGVSSAFDRVYQGYKYWDGIQWACFYCNQISPSLTFPVSPDGKLFSVQLTYSKYDPEDDKYIPTTDIWHFYSPTTPSIEVPVPNASNDCITPNGSIFLSDESSNYPEMPRWFKLKTASGAPIASSGMLRQNSYFFDQLAAGTYLVEIATECGLSAQKTVVVGGPANLGAKINGPSSLCLGTGTQLIALGGDSYLWSNGATSSSITVLPSTPGLHTYSV